MNRRLLLNLAIPVIASAALPAALHAASAEPLALALLRRYFDEVWNRGHLDVLDELLDPAYINHTPSTPNPAPGPAGLKPIVAGMRRAFPDLHFSLEDVFSTAGRAVARTIMTGTHEGVLFGLPATGRRVRVNQINIERIENGRIVEHWRVTDELTLMRQLGFVQS